VSKVCNFESNFLQVT